MSLAATDLTLRRGGRTILSGIDLAVEPGELVALIGPNGAGKSSLIRCLDGIWRGDAGIVTLDGAPLDSLGRAAVARRIAYVPQAAGETLALSVREMVTLGRAPHRTTDTAADRQGRVDAALRRFGLEGLAGRPFDRLSGGERQRVLLARAMVQEAGYLLLDEPTSALDLRHQLAALIAVRALVDEVGVGALVALHDLAAAARFADRVVLLAEGRLHAAGHWSDVLTPATLRDVYGVTARIGTIDGLPYVVADGEA